MRILLHRKKNKESNLFESFPSNARNIRIYYTNTSEIPSELSRENFISSHVNITCYREEITVVMVT